MPRAEARTAACSDQLRGPSLFPERESEKAESPPLNLTAETHKEKPVPGQTACHLYQKSLSLPSLPSSGKKPALITLGPSSPIFDTPFPSLSCPRHQMTPGAHHLYPPRLGTLSCEHPTHTQNASAWGKGAARENAASEVREAEGGRCLLNPIVEGGWIWGGDTDFLGPLLQQTNFEI